jgi:hypothetical protein
MLTVLTPTQDSNACCPMRVTLAGIATVPTLPRGHWISVVLLLLRSYRL